jgi:hypothetical protein
MDTRLYLVAAPNVVQQISSTAVMQGRAVLTTTVLPMIGKRKMMRIADIAKKERVVQKQPQPWTPICAATQ